jgi:hypothetical protein
MNARLKGCLSKQPYHSQEEAERHRRAAETRQPGHKLHSYPCPFAADGHWHIGRQRKRGR